MENVSFTATTKEVSQIFTATTKIDKTTTALSSLDIFWTFSILIITVLSFGGNLLVCVTLLRRHYLLTSSNRLVLSLSISNALYAVIVLPFAFISSITKKWLFGEVWCIFVGCTNLTIVGCSMLTLLLISADRYFVIIHPLKYSSHIKGLRVVGLLIFCWVFSFSSALVPIFKPNLIYKFFASSFTCLPLWKSSHGFSLFWVSSFIIVPYLCVVIIYCCIFGIAHKKHLSNHHKRTSSNISHKDMPLYHEIDKENTKHSTTVGTPGGKHQQSLSTISVLDDSGVIKSKFVKHKSILHSATNLPHQVSYADDNPEPDTVNVTCPSDLSLDPNTGSCVLENISKGNGNSTNPVSKILMSSQEFMGHSCDHNPHIAENPRPKSQKTCGFVTSQDGETRPSTSHSFRRYSFCGRSMGFSHLRYYRNMPKACGTILVIVGLLFVNFGPFAIVTLLFTFNENSNVPDWAVSLSTILLYFSCFYYPLIYGIWNETLRKEMVTILRRKSRGPRTRRTRILSLSTHLKDLGISARLTTAIMGESAAMASIVYPMQIDSRIVKRLKSINKRSRPRSEHTTSRRMSKTRKHVGAESDKIRASSSQKLTKVSAPAKSETSESKTQPREREQPLSDPFQVESTDILGSELLQSALLYGLSDNLVVSNQNALDACVPQTSASLFPQTTTKSPPMQSPQNLPNHTESSKNLKRNTSEGNLDYKPNQDKPSTSSPGHLIPAETFKMLKSSLIHLEAGEPIKVRQWDKSQYVDFFAQTLAFDLLNDAK